MNGDGPYGMIRDGALAVTDGCIAWVGPRDAVPRNTEDRVTINRCNGRWITPGLIDCHTHLVYAGDRAREFEQRLLGASYETIAREGGGILSTVKATRAASVQELEDATRKRLDALSGEGVTTVEIKSGYGLDIDTECKQLETARRLANPDRIDVTTTYLGAHTLPPEFTDADAYIDFVCNDALPAVVAKDLADAVDVFCETVGFNLAQTERVLDAATRRGLPVKVHAEQFSDLGGARLAAEYGALSADHLEYASAKSVHAMAGAGTVAVLLPGAFYVLNETRKPPIDQFRKYGVPFALATDSNPGSSPVTSLLLMLNMACTLFRLTPEEALMGVTRNAARALGAIDKIGTLQAGKAADFVLWDIDHPAELAYRIGDNPCQQVVKRGTPITRPVSPTPASRRAMP